MYFFTHGDDVALSLAEVRSMMSWNLDLELSIGTLKALGELQESNDGEPSVHRASLQGFLCLGLRS